MPDFHYADLTAEEVVKTPFKYGEAKEDDATQIKALDWVVEWATKKGLQLVFINIVSAKQTDLCKEEDHEFIHVNAIYTKNIQ